MLYTRMFECELAAANMKPPLAFRIALPKSIQVLEPLAAALSSIGIVEDAALGAMYIPVAKPVKDGKYQRHDPEDVTEFLEWNQYDWNASWAQVEIARRERRIEAREKGVNVPEGTFQPNHDKLTVWENLALEKWLGWDDNLWFCYEQATQVLSRKASFVDFPRHPAGNYAWLIPRSEDDSGAFCRIPKPLSIEIWMIALLFNLSALPSERTFTWYHRTKEAPFFRVADMLHKFLDAAIKE
jgi:hypothetical protein